MASTSEKVRPVEEEAYAPENYADVFPELPQAPPLEVTQWPAKTPAAWKTNVRPSKCTQVRISLQNYMLCRTFSYFKEEKQTLSRCVVQTLKG